MKKKVVGKPSRVAQDTGTVEAEQQLANTEEADKETQHSAKAEETQEAEANDTNTPTETQQTQEAKDTNTPTETPTAKSSETPTTQTSTTTTPQTSTTATTTQPTTQQTPQTATPQPTSQTVKATPTPTEKVAILMRNFQRIMDKKEPTVVTKDALSRLNSDTSAAATYINAASKLCVNNKDSSIFIDHAWVPPTGKHIADVVCTILRTVNEPDESDVRNGFIENVNKTHTNEVEVNNLKCEYNPNFAVPTDFKDLPPSPTLTGMQDSEILKLLSHYGYIVSLVPSEPSEPSEPSVKLRKWKVWLAKTALEVARHFVEATATAATTAATDRFKYVFDICNSYVVCTTTIDFYHQPTSNYTTNSLMKQRIQGLILDSVSKATPSNGSLQSLSTNIEAGSQANSSEEDKPVSSPSSLSAPEGSTPTAEQVAQTKIPKKALYTNLYKAVDVYKEDYSRDSLRKLIDQICVNYVSHTMDIKQLQQQATDIKNAINHLYTQHHIKQDERKWTDVDYILSRQSDEGNISKYWYDLMMHNLIRLACKVNWNIPLCVNTYLDSYFEKLNELRKTFDCMISRDLSCKPEIVDNINASAEKWLKAVNRTAGGGGDGNTVNDTEATTDNPVNKAKKAKLAHIESVRNKLIENKTERLVYIDQAFTQIPFEKVVFEILVEIEKLVDTDFDKMALLKKGMIEYITQKKPSGYDVSNGEIYIPHLKIYVSLDLFTSEISNTVSKLYTDVLQQVVFNNARLPNNTDELTKLLSDFGYISAWYPELQIVPQAAKRVIEKIKTLKIDAKQKYSTIVDIMDSYVMFTYDGHTVTGGGFFDDLGKWLNDGLEATKKLFETLSKPPQTSEEPYNWLEYKLESLKGIVVPSIEDSFDPSLIPLLSSQQQNSSGGGRKGRPLNSIDNSNHSNRIDLSRIAPLYAIKLLRIALISLAYKYKLHCLTWLAIDFLLVAAIALSASASESASAYESHILIDYVLSTTLLLLTFYLWKEKQMFTVEQVRVLTVVIILLPLYIFE